VNLTLTSRRWGLTVAATAASLIASTVIVAVTAVPAVAASAITAHNFRLTKTNVTTSQINALEDLLNNVSFSEVVLDGNRDASLSTPPSISNERTLFSFTWNADDRAATNWYPQGITTTEDAYTAGDYEGHSAALVSWYDHDDTDGIDRGLRVTFVNLDSLGSAPTYRHTLLVEPYTTSSGQPSFRSIAGVHGGGIVLYGTKLYVADTENGFRVFDLNHMWEVKTGDSSKIGRQSDGYYGLGYKYVIPQAYRYTQSTTGGYAPLHFSFVSLDRTSSPDSLVVGEYSADDPEYKETRIVRWGIDYTDRELRVSDGCICGTEAYKMGLKSMQGVAAAYGRFYFSTSDGSSNNGDLYAYTPGGSVASYIDALAIGPEDFSYSPNPLDPTIWTLTEHPNKRYVYSFWASGY